MNIANNIIREHLKNVYFLCGGAYGGKTTMAKLLEEKYGFIRYRQGDHSDEYAAIATNEEQPFMSMDRGLIGMDILHNHRAGIPIGCRLNQEKKLNLP